jgi:Spy/CpxP family protein refolding chaperone
MSMRWTLGLAPVALAMMVGCSGNSAPANSPGGSSTSDVAPAGTTPTDEQDESMGDLVEHHQHHHHGGFAMFIAMSAESLGTTPEQTAAIEKIRADMHAKMMPAHDAEKKVLGILADDVAAGKIDQAQLDAAASEVSKAAAGVHAAVADAINQLHSILTPTQRAALVTKVEAHFHVWHKANSGDESAEKDARGGRVGKLAKELNLSSDQVDKIRANFKASSGAAPAQFDAAEAEAHLKAFGTAFASETFDSKTLTTGTSVNSHVASWGVTRMSRFYGAVVPVLTAEQRTKLAESLRRHANYKRTQNET